MFLLLSTSIFIENLGQEYVNTVEWLKCKSVRIIFRPYKITTSLIFILSVSQNKPLAGEILVYNNDTDTEYGVWWWS